MIKKLTIENFKAFSKRQEIPLAPITLIYGPNSGGKSSVLQSLLLLVQSFQGNPDTSRRLVLRGDYVDLGSYSTLINRHNDKLNLTLGVTFTTPTLRTKGRGPYSLRPLRESRTVDFTFGSMPDSRRGGDRISTKKILLQIGAGEVLNLTLNRAQPDSSKSPFSRPEIEDRFDFDSPKDVVNLARYVSAYESITQKIGPILNERNAPINPDDEFLGLYRAVKIPDYVSKVLSKSKFSSQSLFPTRLSWYTSPFSRINRNDKDSIRDIELYERFGLNYLIGPFSPLAMLAEEFFTLLRSVSYLGPLRSPAERYYFLSGGDQESVGVKGERAAQMIHQQKSVIAPILNNWFKNFEIPYSLEVQSPRGQLLTGEIISIVLKDQSDVEVSPSDVGFGIGQLLPILVEGIISYDRVICVEQPEIHLHPRLQAHIADFLIETATKRIRRSGMRSPSEIGGNQWIVETHSEALLLRLRRRIREKIIKPEMVSVLYVQPSAEAGSNVQLLSLDENGDFETEWPGGFFDERFNEIFT